MPRKRNTPAPAPEPEPEPEVLTEVASEVEDGPGGDNLPGPEPTMPLPLPNTRESVVRVYGRQMREGVAKLRREATPADDGVVIVPAADLDTLVDRVFSAPLPAVDEHSAEVLTPATITVWATCPSCGIGQPITMTIGDELRVTNENDATLRLTAKAKPVSHLCGQLTLPRTTPVPVEGQTTIDDIIPDRCPFPGCSLVTEHAGPHDGPAPEAEEVDLPDDPFEE